MDQGISLKDAKDAKKTVSSGLNPKASVFFGELSGFARKFSYFAKYIICHLMPSHIT
jgi:hypothetical protein